MLNIEDKIYKKTLKKQICNFVKPKILDFEIYSYTLTHIILKEFVDNDVNTYYSLYYPNGELKTSAWYYFSGINTLKKRPLTNSYYWITSEQYKILKKYCEISV